MEIFRLDKDKGLSVEAPEIPQPDLTTATYIPDATEKAARRADFPGLPAYDVPGAKSGIEGVSTKDRQVITAIKPALKNPHRVNIFINNKYDFSLDLAQLADFKLHVGDQITSAQLTEYRHASEFGKLYQRTLEWLLARPHSIKETRDYLRRRQFRRVQENRQRARNQEKPKEIRRQFHLKTKSLPEISDTDIEQVIHRLCERNYLNDVKFTTFYIENRFVKKGISHKRLRQELAKKGIDNDTIEQALIETPRDELAEIEKVIAKKRTKYPDDQKLIQYLMRQGFDYGLIHEALSSSQNQS